MAGISGSRFATPFWKPPAELVQMSRDLVLMTGVTGHAGFRTLVTALQDGYQVRAAVRKTEQVQIIKDAVSTQPFLDQLEVVAIPDHQIKSAFLPHLKGVKFVVHLASPLPFPTDDYERDLIGPAVQGTLRILEDAATTPSVQRLVITSSINALIPNEFFCGESSDGTFDSKPSVCLPILTVELMPRRSFDL